MELETEFIFMRKMEPSIKKKKSTGGGGGDSDKDDNWRGRDKDVSFFYIKFHPPTLMKSYRFCFLVDVCLSH